MPMTILALWEITLDGYVCGVHWAQILQSIWTHGPPWASVLLVFFVSVTKLGVITIISGIFTTYAMKNAEEDTVFIMEPFALDLLKDADSDGDAQISWDEFATKLKHPLLVEFLPDVARNPAKAKWIFTQIDSDGSGKCDLDELVLALAQRVKA